MTMRTLSVLMLVLAVGFFSLSCASNKPKPAEPTGTQMKATNNEGPDWTRKGCNAYPGVKAEEKICAVGIMTGTRNPDMCREGAETRGLARIARSLKTRVKSLVMDYQKTITGGDQMGRSADDEQMMVKATEQVTDMTLTGTEMLDSYVTENGTCFALMALDVQKFRDMVAGMKELKADLRDHVEKSAAEAFKKLEEVTDTEEAK